MNGILAAAREKVVPNDAHVVELETRLDAMRERAGLCKRSTLEQLLKAQHGGHHITYDATQAETDRLFEQAMLRKKALSLVELQNRKWLKMHKMHIPHKLTAAQKREVRDCFELLDADGSGALDISEVIKGFRVLNIPSKRSEIVALLASMGLGPDEEVNFNTFEEMMTSKMAEGGGAGGQMIRAADMMPAPPPDEAAQKPAHQLPFSVVAQALRRKSLIDVVMGGGAERDELATRLAAELEEKERLEAEKRAARQARHSVASVGSVGAGGRRRSSVTLDSAQHQEYLKRQAAAAAAAGGAVLPPTQTSAPPFLERSSRGGNRESTRDSVATAATGDAPPWAEPPPYQSQAGILRRPPPPESEWDAQEGIPEEDDGWGDPDAPGGVSGTGSADMPRTIRGQGYSNGRLDQRDRSRLLKDTYLPGPSEINQSLLGNGGGGSVSGLPPLSPEHSLRALGGGDASFSGRGASASPPRGLPPPPLRAASGRRRAGGAGVGGSLRRGGGAASAPPGASSTAGGLSSLGGLGDLVGLVPGYGECTHLFLPKTRPTSSFAVWERTDEVERQQYGSPTAGAHSPTQTSPDGAGGNRGHNPFRSGTSTGNIFRRNSSIGSAASSGRRSAPGGPTSGGGGDLAGDPGKGGKGTRRLLGCSRTPAWQRRGAETLRAPTTIFTGVKPVATSAPAAAGAGGGAGGGGGAAGGKGAGLHKVVTTATAAVGAASVFHHAAEGQGHHHQGSPQHLNRTPAAGRKQSALSTQASGGVGVGASRANSGAPPPRTPGSAGGGARRGGGGSRGGSGGGGAGGGDNVPAIARRWAGERAGGAAGDAG